MAELEPNTIPLSPSLSLSLSLSLFLSLSLSLSLTHSRSVTPGFWRTPWKVAVWGGTLTQSRKRAMLGCLGCHAIRICATEFSTSSNESIGNGITWCRFRFQGSCLRGRVDASRSSITTGCLVKSTIEDARSKRSGSASLLCRASQPQIWWNGQKRSWGCLVRR